MRSFSSNRLSVDTRGQTVAGPIPWRPEGKGRGQRLATGSCSTATTVFGWILFAGMLVVALGLCFNGVIAQDEGELLVYPSLLLRGAKPYVDVWMMYPPSTYLALAGLMKIGIPGLLAERGLGMVARIGYVLLVNRALTGSWVRFSWLGVPVAFALIFIQPVHDLQIRAYPWLVGLPFLFLGLRALQRRPVGAAILFITAGTFRFEFGFAGLVAVSLMTLLMFGDRSQMKRLLAATIATAGGLLGFYLLLAVLTDGEAIRQIVLDPIQRIGPARALPLVPLDLPLAVAPLALVTVLGPVAMAVLGLSLRRPYIAATNAGLIPLLGHLVQRADSQYLFWTAALIVPWILVSMVDLIRIEAVPRSNPMHVHRKDRWLSRLIAWISLSIGPPFGGILILYTLWISPISVLSPTSLWHGHSRFVTGSGNTILAMTSAEARDDRQIIGYISQHAYHTDSIFVAPTRIRNAMWNATELYYVLGLRPATRYLEMNPGVETQPEVQREIIGDLSTCRWVVLWKHGYWYEANGTRQLGSPLLARFIHHRYRLALQNPDYEVLTTQLPATTFHAHGKTAAARASATSKIGNGRPVHRTRASVVLRLVSQRKVDYGVST